MEYQHLNGKCPIWATSASTNPVVDGTKVVSPRAGGEYIITGSAIAVLGRLTDVARARLTTWLVEQRSLGNSVPTITSDIVSYAESSHSLDVIERAGRLLDYFSSEASSIAEELSYDPEGWIGQEMLAVSESNDFDEVDYLIKYLKSEGYIEANMFGGGGVVNISMKGHAKLSERSSRGSSTDQAFVAMWFDASMNDAYENGVVLGITDAGYRPVRIDRKDHNNKIDDEIISESGGLDF